LESNRTNTLPVGDNTSEESDDYAQNSLLNYYLENDDNLNRNSATENHQDISTLATPSLASDTDSDIDTTNTRDDDTLLNLEEENDQDMMIHR
jgi:tRNA G18 (ribose-2'-O)-methylase SpoU